MEELFTVVGEFDLKKPDIQNFYKLLIEAKKNIHSLNMIDNTKLYIPEWFTNFYLAIANPNEVYFFNKPYSNDK